MFDFGLYTQVSDSGPQGPLVLRFDLVIYILIQHDPVSILT